MLIIMSGNTYSSQTAKLVVVKAQSVDYEQQPAEEDEVVITVDAYQGGAMARQLEHEQEREGQYERDLSTIAPDSDDDNSGDSGKPNILFLVTDQQRWDTIGIGKL